MKTVKIRTRRQITIPKSILDELGLREGDYVEVTRDKDYVVIRPKGIGHDDELTAEEEKIVEEGFEQLKRGECVAWEKLKNELDL